MYKCIDTYVTHILVGRKRERERERQKKPPPKMCVIQIQQDDNMGHGQKQVDRLSVVRQVYV